MPKGNRGGRRAASAASAASPAEPTDGEMLEELNKHFERVNSVIDKFMSAKPGTVSLDDIDPELDMPSYIERTTVKEIISDYVWEYNSDLEHFGDGLEFMGQDDFTMSILFKDGTATQVGYGRDWPSNKKIPASQIDSVIIEAGWGTVIAGKHVEMFNMRERLPYAADRPGQRWNVYRNVKERYNDEDDIRVDFTNVARWRKA